MEWPRRTSMIYCWFITPTEMFGSRSASRGLSLVVPSLQTQAYGARSFPVVAPTIWNSLPVDFKNAQTLFLFKRKLRTSLFNQF